ncbi:TonB-dependent receptor, partial [Pseudomonas sp. HMWF010]
IRLYRTGGTTTARTQGAQVTDIEAFAFPMSTLGNIDGGDITGAYTGKFDVSREAELFGLPTKVQFGGLFTDRTKKSREFGYTRTFASSEAPAWNAFATSTGYLGSQNLNYTFRYTDKGYTNALMKSEIKAGRAVYNNGQANYWKVSETITAAYGMATTRFDWGNVVYGARVEKIENTGEAFVAFPAAGSTPAGNRLVKTSSDETLVYPSAHLNWDVRENVKVRFGITTSASRPDFDDLRPNYTFSDAAQTISGGNPYAKPEKQIGLDTYVEWYMAPEGFFSAGVFYKDIKDVLVQTSGLFGNDSLNSNGIDRSSYTVSRIDNGGDGHLQGLEVFYSGTAK